MRNFLILLGLCLSACNRDGGEKPAPAPSGGGRFDAVKAQPRAAADARQFCEKTYPPSGPTARKYVPPAEQPLPGGVTVPAAPEKHWKYVNLWATWCKPCMEEMGLFARWREAFDREKAPVSFELLSIDAADAADAIALRLRSGMPGNVRWVRGQEDLNALLDAFGVERTAAIPIHALVDPEGMIRCVRVGAIHAEDLPAIKGLIGG